MIDVIITSTCRKTIKQTLSSFLEHVICSEKFHFIVNVDVKNLFYLPYLKSYLDKMQITDININLHPGSKNTAHGNAINYLFNQLKSPYYFHLEDDWIFLKKIHLDPLLVLMEKNDFIHHIRFNKDRIKDYAWLYHLSPTDTPPFRKMQENVLFNDIPLVKTYVWSFNPSIARTATIKQMLPICVDSNCEKDVCSQFDHLFSSNGAYIWGRIGDEAAIQDIGRNTLLHRLRRIKQSILM
jgi:hypothetical protein